MGNPYHDKGLLPNRAGEQVRRERTALRLPGDVPEDLVYIRQSEIDRLRTALEQAERERDEARGLLREAKGWCPQPESVGQAGAFSPRQRTSLRDRTDAHLSGESE